MNIMVFVATSINKDIVYCSRFSDLCFFKKNGGGLLFFLFSQIHTHKPDAGSFWRKMNLQSYESLLITYQVQFFYRSVEIATTHKL